MLKFIDHDTVASVLTMGDLIPAMRQAMVDYSSGSVTQPPRRLIEVKPHGGFFGSMPAAGASALGAKLVTFYPGNAAKSIATHMAVIVLFEPTTGEPRVIMDGELITAMRTAAVTATFIDAVAAQDVRSLAVLGAGVQARRHIEALMLVRSFDDIRISSRSAARAQSLADEFGAHAMAAEAAVKGADVVILATSSREPVIDGRWLKDGAKVASVGWGGADGGEADAVTMSHLVVVDSREGTQLESGNIRRFDAQIFAELGEVLGGKCAIDPTRTVVFDSIGMACQDLAAAVLVQSKLAG